MSPNGFELPEGNFFELANIQPIDKIWKILWSVDPAYLTKIHPNVIKDLIDARIDYELTRVELQTQLMQKQTRLLKEFKEKISLG